MAPFCPPKYRKAHFDRIARKREQPFYEKQRNPSADHGNANVRSRGLLGCYQTLTAVEQYTSNLDLQQRLAPQAATMLSTAIPSVQSQTMAPDQRFAQFKAFEEQVHTRAFQYYEKFMLSEKMPPPILQAQYMNPGRPSKVKKRKKPRPNKQRQEGPMTTGTDRGDEHDATTSSYTSSIHEQEALGSNPALEPLLKRKFVDPIPETYKSSRPRHAATLENGTNDTQPSLDSVHLVAESKVDAITISNLSSNTANVIQTLETIHVNDNQITLPTSQIPLSLYERGNLSYHRENFAIFPETPLQVDPEIKLSSPSVPFEGNVPDVALHRVQNTESLSARESSSATPNPTVMTMSSSASVQDHSSLPNRTSASSVTTLDGMENPSSHNYQTTSNPLSKDNINKLVLECTIQLAESKFDDPEWREGVPLDEFVVVLGEHFTDLRPPNWYSAQTILAWRASLSIPSNWIVVLDDEDPNKFPISETITDIVQIRLEEERKHWTVVHLSIKDWTTTYYDSYLGKGSKTGDDLNMKSMCTGLVETVLSKFPKHGIILPSWDPLMSAKVS